MRSPNPVGIGLLLLAIAFAAILAYSADRTIRLNEELHKNCNLPEDVCPFSRTVPSETVAGFGVSAAAGAAGVYLLRRGKPSPAAPPTIEAVARAVAALDAEERGVYDLLVRQQGFIFQSDLAATLGMNKVKMTRVLDKLEGKGLVERKRRGMANAVVLKHPL